MSSATRLGRSRRGGYPRMTMSETELSVICKNCGSEVSPYVTECPYCGARLRKRAPKLERRGDALEAQLSPPPVAPAELPRPQGQHDASANRPYATMAVILGSATLLLLQKATGDPLSTFGGLIVPYAGRLVALPHRPLRLCRRRLPLRRRGRPGDLLDRRRAAPRHPRRPACCCSPAARSACSPRVAIANAQGEITVIAGGNGMALGAVAAWFAIRRAEAHRIDRRGVRRRSASSSRRRSCWRCRSSLPPPTSSPAWSAAPSAASPASPPPRCASTPGG